MKETEEPRPSTSHLPEKTRAKRAHPLPTKSGTVVLVGRPNVGKSTLLNAALGQAIAIVSPVPQTTRHRVLGVLRRGDCELILLDTPGMHSPMSRLGRALNRTARAASEEADVVVFVVDAAGARRSTRPESLLHPGDRTLLETIGAEVPTVLVVNKVDLLKSKARLLPLLDAFSELREFAAVVPISALEQDGVDRVLDEASKLLPAGPPRFAEDDLTDMPTKFFAGEFIREQVLLNTRKEVPHACAVQIDLYEDLGRTVRIEATILVEREGQKRILIGKGGAMMKEIGTRARQRIEAFLGRHVQLSLWARVTPGWPDSPAALGELGYEETQ